MKYALGIEYDGATFFGWQRQKEVNSVQQELEQALSKVANHDVEAFCAGRTDAGVHATGQVIHFESDSKRNLRAWTLGINSNLPDSIAVTWCKPVADEFHARYSAFSRTYRYIILNRKLRPGILRSGITHFYEALDESKMHEAAQSLLGEQDFTSFRAVHCQSKSPFRNITQVEVKRTGDYVILQITANAFLHHMVRNIVGTLCEIGTGQKPVSWVQELITLKDRTQCAATAKPNGLYLVDVGYPDEFELPTQPLGPIFLPDNW